MKRILIHGWKSLIRRPAKTVMLFVILFVVFNLIFTGFVIQKSVVKSKEYIRSQIGSVVEYKMDYTKLMAAVSKAGSTTTMTRPPALSLTVAEKMAKNSYVTGYYVTDSANANSSTITAASTSSNGNTFSRNSSSFALSGTNTTDNLDFVLGNVTLKSGKTLSADDVNNVSNVVIISDSLATTNSLNVGDTIKLTKATMNRGGETGTGGTASASTSTSTSKSTTSTTSTTTTSTAVDFTVIGIYTAKSTDFDVNTMFTSNAAVDSFNGTTASDETEGSIDFILDSADHVEPFITQCTPYLTSEYHVLSSDDSEYESLTKPLDLISLITSILIGVVFVAGALIILALVTIFVRDRKFEIGLLLSSGEGRMKIITQFMFEILAIAIVAFAVSIATSNLTSGVVSNWIVNNQLLSSSSLIGSTSTTTTANQFQMGGRNTTTLYGEVDMQNVADKFNVSVDGSVIGELMLASVILVLIGSSIPLIVIMGYKPRRILQDDN
jgi:putative ABC transport system permease protein